MAGKQDKGGIGIQVCVGKTMYPRIVGVKKERPVRTPDGSRVDFPPPEKLRQTWAALAPSKHNAERF